MHPDRHYKEGHSVKYQCHRPVKQTTDTFENSPNVDDVDANAKEDNTPSATDVSSTVKDSSMNESALSFPKPPRYKVGEAKELGMPLTKCDSPWELINGTVDWLLNNVVGHPKDHRDHGKEHLGIDFIICTGDNARHDSDTKIPRSFDHIMIANAKIAAMLDKRLSHVPIVFTIGNNDVYPHNSTQYLEPFIPEDQIHVFLEGGYFIKEVVPNQLAVISLNTIYFYRSNPVVDGCTSDLDPGSMQLAWLEQRMQELAESNMTTYIIGHVSPSPLLYHTQCLRRYSRIIRRWSGFEDGRNTQDNPATAQSRKTNDRAIVVVGQFFGHSNVDHFYFLEEEPDIDDGLEEVKKSDMFRTYKSSYTTTGATSDEYLGKLFKQYKKAGKKGALGPVVQVVPSIIPTYNPALRVVTYAIPGTDDKHADYRLGQPIDYVQYYFDLLDLNNNATTDSSALGHNDNDQKSVIYNVEYRARETYRLSALIPSEFARLAGRLYANNTLRHEYMRRYFVNTIN
ncbi:Metallo-dependent phosphatase-like protein [Syncephalis plumigaleata]|nr:Metallo-dependent phosphatase-like protein [Syncephalis plumigaleata]